MMPSENTFLGLLRTINFKFTALIVVIIGCVSVSYSQANLEEFEKQIDVYKKYISGIDENSQNDINNVKEMFNKLKTAYNQLLPTLSGDCAKYAEMKYFVLHIHQMQFFLRIEDYKEVLNTGIPLEEYAISSKREGMYPISCTYNGIIYSYSFSNFKNNFSIFSMAMSFAADDTKDWKRTMDWALQAVHYERGGLHVKSQNSAIKRYLRICRDQNIYTSDFTYYSVQYVKNCTEYFGELLNDTSAVKRVNAQFDLEKIIDGFYDGYEKLLKKYPNYDGISLIEKLGKLLENPVFESRLNVLRHNEFLFTHHANKLLPKQILGFLQLEKNRLLKYKTEDGKFNSDLDKSTYELFMAVAQSRINKYMQALENETRFEFCNEYELLKKCFNYFDRKDRDDFFDEQYKKCAAYYKKQAKIAKHQGIRMVALQNYPLLFLQKKGTMDWGGNIVAFSKNFAYEIGYKKLNLNRELPIDLALSGRNKNMDSNYYFNGSSISLGFGSAHQKKRQFGFIGFMFDYTQKKYLPVLQDNKPAGTLKRYGFMIHNSITTVKTISFQFFWSLGFSIGKFSINPNYTNANVDPLYVRRKPTSATMMARCGIALGIGWRNKYLRSFD